MAPYTTKGVALKTTGFSRIHNVQQALYIELLKYNPIVVDDEEVLAELSAFAATLTPLYTSKPN